MLKQQCHIRKKKMIVRQRFWHMRFPNFSLQTQKRARKMIIEREILSFSINYLGVCCDSHVVLRPRQLNLLQFQSKAIAHTSCLSLISFHPLTRPLYTLLAFLFTLYINNKIYLIIIIRSSNILYIKFTILKTHRVYYYKSRKKKWGNIFVYNCKKCHGNQ